MKRFLAVLALVFCFAGLSHAQGLRARIAYESAGPPHGDLIVSVAGKEKTLARNVWKFWQFDGGRTLLWAGSDGGGGFENEGQSLWRYDSVTGASRKLVAEVFAIRNVREARGVSGRRVFVLSMVDGGLGAPHIAVIRENGKTVWRQTVARLAAIRNGRIALALLHINDDTSPIRPRRIVYRRIDALLRR